MAAHGDLEELPALLAELRELTTAAHAAIKDTTRATRELRALIDSAARESRDAARTAAIKEMARFQEHIQAEMDRSARDLNRAIGAARRQVVKALTVKSVEEMPGGGLRATFEGNLFDAGDDGPPGRT